MTTTMHFSPGTLVRARGREWILLAGSEGDVLRVRPVSGTEDDATVLHLGLEPEPVTEASFPWPRPEEKAGHDAALLLRDALLLSLRRGAGPFRSFGHIAVEPRAYQLVPLLMALKLDPVRLLVADDVGVGKTIEAALIARELLDRGEIRRLAVLCPPHLVDQWVGELESRFHLRPVAVTAANARRLEDAIPPGESLFSVHPHAVVSLDYIKSQNRRDRFLHTCPEFVIVDEAHTCAATGQGRHQRYELLKGLTASPTRHLVLLTATPHSGDEDAFFRLLGLLDRRFEDLASAEGEERTRLREMLSRHFVQRRRPDIEEWKDGRDGQLFPRRESRELTYVLSGAWERFLEAILDYCAAIVDAAEGDERRQRLNFWGTLALLRCAASSPASAVQALRTRAGLVAPDVEEDELASRLFDGATDHLPDDDVEPPAGSDDPDLAALIAQAEALTGQSDDPKLKVLTDNLDELLKQGFSPVVFCRYIATAHYLGRHLAARFPDTTVGVVTGELTADERKDRVGTLGDANDKRILVSTDCLSEGVNLQDHFDAVVHYDLSWNPTRHEQREGRVDRFGQPRPVVRTTLMYGANNPVDGIVLDVILRKAARIQKELGVPVPVPDEGTTLTQALMKAMLLRRRGREAPVTGKQLEMFDTGWEAAKERARRNRTVFAQRRLKPEEVLPEWHKTLSAIGGRDEVERFTSRALARLGAPLETRHPRRGFKTPLDSLPDEVRERLEAEGLTGTLHLDFGQPPAARCRPIQRSHPLVAVLAETLLERTLNDGTEAGPGDTGILGRVGCWVSDAVSAFTTVVLVRLRHQLTSQREGRTTTLLVEEANALAWTGLSGTPIEGTDALALLAPPPRGDPPLHVRERFVTQALDQLRVRTTNLDAFAERRAQALLADHRRVREAADARGTPGVKALLPADVIGVFVLLPQVD